MAASKIHQNGKPKKTRTKSAKAEAKPKELSALDAAAKVLAETGQPMSCKEMIEAMAQKGYWSSSRVDEGGRKCGRGTNASPNGPPC